MNILVFNFKVFGCYGVIAAVKALCSVVSFSYSMGICEGSEALCFKCSMSSPTSFLTLEGSLRSLFPVSYGVYTLFPVYFVF